MKYNTYCVSLLIGAALLAFPSTLVRAADGLDEDWHDQVVGPMPVQMTLWKHTVSGTSGSGEFVKLNDTKTLEIKAKSDKPFDGFGITTLNPFSWSRSLEISVDCAFSQDTSSTMPEQYRPSFMLIVSSGTVCYQINIRAHGIQIGKNDPDHPNPDPAAHFPNFTLLLPAKDLDSSLLSDDFHNYKLKLKRSDAGIQISVLHDQEETVLGTATDPNPPNFSNGVNVGISVENHAILKIGKVKVTVD